MGIKITDVLEPNFNGPITKAERIEYTDTTNTKTVQQKLDELDQKINAEAQWEVEERDLTQNKDLGQNIVLPLYISNPGMPDTFSVAIYKNNQLINTINNLSAGRHSIVLDQPRFSEKGTYRVQVSSNRIQIVKGRIHQADGSYTEKQDSITINYKIGALSLKSDNFITTIQKTLFVTQKQYSINSIKVDVSGPDISSENTATLKLFIKNPSASEYETTAVQFYVNNETTAQTQLTITHPNQTFYISFNLDTTNMNTGTGGLKLELSQGAELRIIEVNYAVLAANSLEITSLDINKDQLDPDNLDNSKTIYKITQALKVDYVVSSTVELALGASILLTFELKEADDNSQIFESIKSNTLYFTSNIYAGSQYFDYQLFAIQSSNNTFSKKYKIQVTAKATTIQGTAVTSTMSTDEFYINRPTDTFIVGDNLDCCFISSNYNSESNSIESSYESIYTRGQLCKLQFTGVPQLNQGTGELTIPDGTYGQINLTNPNTSLFNDFTIEYYGATGFIGEFLGKSLSIYDNRNSNIFNISYDAAQCSLGLSRGIEPIDSDIDNFVHVVFVYTSEDTTLRLYINGIVSGLVKGNSITNNIPLSNIYINSYLDGNQKITNNTCIFKVLRIYSVALSDNDVYTNYLSCLSTEAADVVKARNNLNTTDLPIIYLLKNTTDRVKFKKHGKIENNTTFSELNSITNKDNSKKSCVNCTLLYTYKDKSNNNDHRYIVLGNVDVLLQGTSSLNYPVKNYKINSYSWRNNSDEDYDKYSWSPISSLTSLQEDYTFTLKCDFMEQSHRNNTPTARVYEQLLDKLISNDTTRDIIQTTVRDSIVDWSSLNIDDQEQILDSDTYTIPKLKNKALGQDDIKYSDAIDGFPVLVYYSDYTQFTENLPTSDYIEGPVTNSGSTQDSTIYDLLEKLQPNKTNSPTLCGTYMFNVDKSGAQLGFNIQLDGNEYKCISLEGASNASTRANGKTVPTAAAFMSLEEYNDFVGNRTDNPKTYDEYIKQTFELRSSPYDDDSEKNYITIKDTLEWLKTCFYDTYTGDDGNEHINSTTETYTDRITLDEKTTNPINLSYPIEPDPDTGELPNSVQYSCISADGIETATGSITLNNDNIAKASITINNWPNNIPEDTQQIILTITYSAKIYTENDLDTVLAKFRAEFPSKFSFTYCLAYFLQLIVFAQVDSAGKNAMFDQWGLTSESTDQPFQYNTKTKLFPRPYDMDTQLGLDNSGYDRIYASAELSQDLTSDTFAGSNLVTRYNGIGQTRRAGDETNPKDHARFYCYNTSDSRLWKTFALAYETEIADAYEALRTPPADQTQAAFYSIENICSIVDRMTSNIIGETFYNFDAKAKYLVGGADFTHCCQGSRVLRYKQFLRQRLSFLDSKFKILDSTKTIYGQASGNNTVICGVSVKTPQYIECQGEQNQGSNVVYADQNTYYQIKGFSNFVYNAAPIAIKITSNNTTTTIHNSPNITKITDWGNIKYNGGVFIGLAPLLTTVELNGLSISSFQTENLKNLRKFHLTSAQNLQQMDFSNNANISDINLSGCRQLREITLPDKCTSLRSINLLNTAVPSIEIKESIITSAALLNGLPKGIIEELTIEACPNITELDLRDFVSLQKIRLANLPNLTTLSLPTATRFSSIQLENLRGIQTLNLEGCAFTIPDEASSNQLTIDLSTCTQLTELNLNGVKCTSTLTSSTPYIAIIMPESSSGFNGLQSLNIMDSSVRALYPKNSNYFKLYDISEDPIRGDDITKRPENLYSTIVCSGEYIDEDNEDTSIIKINDKSYKRISYDESYSVYNDIYKYQNTQDETDTIYAKTVSAADVVDLATLASSGIEDLAFKDNLQIVNVINLNKIGSCYELFRNCANLETVSGNVSWTADSGTANIRYMFQVDTNTQIPDNKFLDITNLSFNNIPNGGLIAGHFAYRSRLTNRSINNFLKNYGNKITNTISNNNDAFMFSSCIRLFELENDTISRLTRTTTLRGAFYACSRLIEVNDTLSKDNNTLENIAGMFSGATSLTKIPTDLLAGCNQLTNCVDLFLNCENLTNTTTTENDETRVNDILDILTVIDSWKTVLPVTSTETSRTIDISRMFMNCKNIQFSKEFISALFDNQCIIRAESTFCDCSLTLDKIACGLLHRCTGLTSIRGLFAGSINPRTVTVDDVSTTEYSSFPGSEVYYSLIRTNASDTTTLESLTDAGGLFYLCRGLTGVVPANLLDGAVNIITLGAGKDTNTTISSWHHYTLGIFSETNITGISDTFFHTYNQDTQEYTSKFTNLTNITYFCAGHQICAASGDTYYAASYCTTTNQLTKMQTRATDTKNRADFGCSIQLLAGLQLTLLDFAFANCKFNFNDFNNDTLEIENINKAQNFLPSSCTSCSHIFADNPDFKPNVLDSTTFQNIFIANIFKNKSRLKDASYSFSNCSGICGDLSIRATRTLIQSQQAELDDPDNQEEPQQQTYSVQQGTSRIFQGCQTLEKLDAMFYNCVNFGAPISINGEVTSFRSGFGDIYSYIAIYSDLFIYDSNTTTYIPITSCSYMFAKSGLVGAINESENVGLFNDCTELQSCEAMFAGCFGLLGRIPQLFTVSDNSESKFDKLISIKNLFRDDIGLCANYPKIQKTHTTIDKDIVWNPNKDIGWGKSTRTTDSKAVYSMLPDGWLNLCGKIQTISGCFAHIAATPNYDADYDYGGNDGIISSRPVAASDFGLTEAKAWNRRLSFTNMTAQETLGEYADYRLTFDQNIFSLLPALTDASWAFACITLLDDLFIDKTLFQASLGLLNNINYLFYYCYALGKANTSSSIKFSTENDSFLGSNTSSVNSAQRAFACTNIKNSATVYSSAAAAGFDIINNKLSPTITSNSTSMFSFLGGNAASSTATDTVCGQILAAAGGNASLIKDISNSSNNTLVYSTIMKNNLQQNKPYDLSIKFYVVT